MKQVVLQLSPILIPSINQKLNELYEVHRYFEIEDKAAFITKHAASIEGVVSGGHTGISKALMEQLPNLKVVAVNGVGTDAVDLAVSYTHLRAHETVLDLVCRLLLEKNG